MLGHCRLCGNILQSVCNKLVAAQLSVRLVVRAVSHGPRGIRYEPCIRCRVTPLAVTELNDSILN